MQPDPALTRARWFKSTASSSDQGCVEIAHLDDRRVAVRDSKNPHAPAHIFTRHEWTCFLHGAKHGEFDPPPN